jgi:hypothetical protein
MALSVYGRASETRTPELAGKQTPMLALHCCKDAPDCKHQGRMYRDDDWWVESVEHVACLGID